MGSLAVLLIIVGCAALEYFKGTIVKAVVTILVVICAGTVAFGYFEPLAGLLTKNGTDSDYPAIVPWAHALCFALLFIVAFALLQTAASQLTRHPVDFGFLPERIGRVVCGIILGLVSSGLLLTVLAMAPLPNKYPYPRFDERNPNPERPAKVLFNADGFMTGWFGMLSNGSFRAIAAPRSFATLRAGFIDQLYLNRPNAPSDTPVLSRSDSIDVEKKAGAWYAPEGLKDSEGADVPAKTGHSLLIVRVGISRAAYTDAGRFTLSQLRLMCKKRAETENPLSGSAVSVYPIGYLTTGNQLRKKDLNDQIIIDSAEFKASNVTHKRIDFAFYVPADRTAVLAGFKLNSLAEVPAPVSADQAPPPSAFVEKTPDKKDSGGPTDSSKRPRTRPDSDPGSRRRGLSNVGKSVVGDDLDGR